MGLNLWGDLGVDQRFGDFRLCRTVVALWKRGIWANQAAFDALGMRDYIWRYPRRSYIQESWFDLGNPG